MDLGHLQYKIEKYINREMEEPERLAFEAEMEAHPELKEEVLYHLLAEEAVNIAIEEEVRAKLNKVKQASSNVVQPVPLWKQPSFRWIAAACMVGLIAWIALRPGNREGGLPSEGYEQKVIALARVPVSDNVKGAGTEDDPWADCSRLFAEAAYAQALSCFETKDNTHLTVQQYVAHCHMQLKQYELAAQQFDRLRKELSGTNDPALLDKATFNWLLALAAQRDEQVQPPLDSLLRLPAFRYYTELQQLQEIIESE
jgi:tetratricopeptide (TPR) repeat protein